MGATAAIITSLALIAGLAHGDSTRTSIIAGLLIIAIADNIADSLSFHIFKEAEGACKKEVYSSTLGNFIVRFVLALTFVAIILLLPSNIALVVSIVWGLFLLTILSYSIAKAQKINPFKETIWHLFIASLVIVGSKLLGDLISDKIIR
jgi:vacuolar iron transporter family protein